MDNDGKYPFDSSWDSLVPKDASSVKVFDPHRGKMVESNQPPRRDFAKMVGFKAVLHPNTTLHQGGVQLINSGTVPVMVTVQDLNL